MKPAPLVDVIIVTYNHKNYIAQTLEGVLMQQTSFRVNIMVGDDCSTDGTVDILKKYETQFPEQLDVIYQEKNLGPWHPERNIVLMFRKSKAKYIALLDGDDYWIDPLKLQKQVDFLEANPDFSLSFHNTMIRHEYKSGVNKESALFNKNLTQDVFELKDIADGWIAHTSSLVFTSRDLLPLPDWFSTSFTGDLLIILLLAGRGKIKYLNFTGSVYRLNDGGVGQKYHGRFLVEGKIKLYTQYNEYFGYKHAHIINPIIGKYYFLLVPMNIRALEFGKAFSNFFRALRLKPKGLFTDFPFFSSIRSLFRRMFSVFFKPKGQTENALSL
ncbi:MAG: glycosyl transferase family 2 [Bacteroidetes bacterium]|jgi:glycosyltransferase involved in cell wall biosynthesis|nr:glycosyl transferase family 2 [Bacteroidota bacterium]